MAHRNDLNKNIRRVVFELLLVISPFIMVMMVRDVTQFQDLIGEDVDLMLDSKNLDGLQVFSKGFQYMTQWLPFEQNSRLGLAISYGLYTLYGIATVCVLFHLYVFYAICIVECTARKWTGVIDFAKQLV